MTRSLVREHLFKLLFRIEFNSPEDMPDQVRLYFEDGFADEDHASTGSDVPESDREYIRTKYEKIVELLPEIDAKKSGLTMAAVEAAKAAKAAEIKVSEQRAEAIAKKRAAAEAEAAAKAAEAAAETAEAEVAPEA